jgi:hypothetical protein
MRLEFCSSEKEKKQGREQALCRDLRNFAGDGGLQNHRTGYSYLI